MPYGQEILGYTRLMYPSQISCLEKIFLPLDYPFNKFLLHL